MAKGMADEDLIPGVTSEPIPGQPYLDLETLGRPPEHGGWRIAEHGEHWIDVVPMAWGNFRIVLTDKGSPHTYVGGWCYAGPTASRNHLRAVAAAWLWSIDGGDEPKGWNKNVATGEWRENGDAERPGIGD